MDVVLPPGPPLPAPAQTALLTTWQQPFLRSCHRRHGDCFTLRITGLGTMVYLTDPDALRAVFTGPATTFDAGEANTPLGPILGESSLLLLDEDEHMARRKQLLPRLRRFWPWNRLRRKPGRRRYAAARRDPPRPE